MIIISHEQNIRNEKRHARIFHAGESSGPAKQKITFHDGSQGMLPPHKRWWWDKNAKLVLIAL